MFRFTIRDLIWLTLVAALVVVIIRDRLPTEARPTALDGYCPVFLVEQHRWHKGDPQHAAVFEGRTYFFKSNSERASFLAKPDKYAPEFGGYDPVRLVEENRKSPGLRRHGLTYKSRIYLFDSEESLDVFTKSTEKYVRR